MCKNKIFQRELLTVHPTSFAVGLKQGRRKYALARLEKHLSIKVRFCTHN
jgi:hypothetical protein